MRVSSFTNMRRADCLDCTSLLDLGHASIGDERKALSGLVLLSQVSLRKVGQSDVRRTNWSARLRTLAH